MIRSSRFRATAGCALLALAVSCGKNEAPVNPNTVLCRGESDVAMQVTGGTAPVDICVDTKDVPATIAADRYDITIPMQQGNVIYELRMVFDHHDNFPVILNVTGDPGAAAADPDGVWLYYQEIPAGGGGGIESTVAAGGTFRLGFSGRDVVTGQLQNITFDMQDISTQAAAGTREIPEGLFSLSVATQLIK